ncbi:hypothetical protein [Helicobacter sp. NHP22-001]|uniref:hypothetical protein n=1 Tax=Helicobacter sp. NHP22-001 TaxID=3040202 RepID=UPI00244D7D76|nr:hypothetical protein [Helicobacter sp. NHP22-001]GMB95735.1 Putative lipoprotein [Helicobacter sp. NHP22-001]
MRKLYGVCSVAVAGLILGCAHTASRGELDRFQQAYYAKDHKQADQVSKAALKEDKKQKDAPLWNLEDGVNAFMMGQYKASLDTLDKANKTFDTNFKSMEKGIAKAGAATLGSAINVPYEGHMYEWTLTNYYMALDYAFLGNKQDARVEFNRTIDRERRIKEAYKKQIKKTQEEMEKAKQKNGAMFSKLTAGTAGWQSELDKTFSNLAQFKTYTGFINPLVDYVSGLFFASTGDSKGIDDLKEAYGVSQNKIVGEDLKNFMDHTKEKFTWVIVEDGKQPTLGEFKMPSINLALPKLKDGQAFHTNFSVVVDGKSEKMGVLSNFNVVVQKEFQTTLPVIRGRAISSAILKTAAGKGMETAGQFVPGVGGAVMSGLGSVMRSVNKASTAADTRGSNVFPSMVYLGRVDNKAHKFSIQIDNLHQDFTIAPCNGKPAAPGQVCGDTNNIIFVRTFPNDLNVKSLSL